MEPTRPLQSREIPYLMSLAFFDMCSANSNSKKKESQYVHGQNILRSRFEVVGAESLDELDLEYKYEVNLITNYASYSLDLLIAVREKNRCVGIELCGRFGEPKYMHDFYEKFKDYSESDLVPWQDIVYIFGGKDWMPSMEQIKRIIVMAVENC